MKRVVSYYYIIGLVVLVLFGRVMVRAQSVGMKAIQCKQLQMIGHAEDFGICQEFVDSAFMPKELSSQDQVNLKEYCRCLVDLGTCETIGKGIEDMGSCKLEDVFSVGTFDDLQTVTSHMIALMDYLNDEYKDRNLPLLIAMAKIVASQVCSLANMMVPLEEK